MSYSFFKMLQAFYPFECFENQNIVVTTYYNPLCAWWHTCSLGAVSSDMSLPWPLSPPLVKSVSIALSLLWTVNPSLLEHVPHDSITMWDTSTSLPDWELLWDVHWPWILPLGPIIPSSVSDQASNALIAPSCFPNSPLQQPPHSFYLLLECSPRFWSFYIHFP